MFRHLLNRILSSYNQPVKRDLPEDINRQNPVAKEFSSSPDFIHNSHKIQGTILKRHQCNLSNDRRLIEDYGLHTLAFQSLEKVSNPLPGLGENLIRLFKVAIGKYAFFGNSSRGQEVVKTLSLRLDDLDVAMPGQTVQVTVDHSKADAKFFAEGPLGDRIPLCYLIKDLEGMYGIQMISFIVLMHRSLRICFIYEHSNINASSKNTIYFIYYSIGYCIVSWKREFRKYSFLLEMDAFSKPLCSFLEHKGWT